MRERTQIRDEMETKLKEVLEIQAEIYQSEVLAFVYVGAVSIVLALIGEWQMLAILWFGYRVKWAIQWMQIGYTTARRGRAAIKLDDAPQKEK